MAPNDYVPSLLLFGKAVFTFVSTVITKDQEEQITMMENAGSRVTQIRASKRLPLP